MTFYYVHHGAGLTLTVNQPTEDEAVNNRNAVCSAEGWPLEGWTLEPKPEPLEVGEVVANRKQQARGFGVGLSENIIVMPDPTT